MMLFRRDGYYICMHKDISQGTYAVQNGNRGAFIDCADQSHRIEVSDARTLRILHGSTVYWAVDKSKIHRSNNGRSNSCFSCEGKPSRTVIHAVVIGLKHCPYLHDGKPLLCTFKKQQDKIVGYPTNSRLPIFDLLQHPTLLQMYLGDHLQTMYFWARLISFEEQRPKGCLAAIFSHNFKTVEVQTDVILHNLDILATCPSMLNNVSTIPLPITTHLHYPSMMFTIDPPNSIDIEDGLSLQIIGNQYEVGVHISDVGAYKHLIQRQQSAIRGCSFYLPHKTIHLLPNQLVTACALTHQQQRLTMSVFFRVDQNNCITSVRFQKCIVKSKAQLTYDEAQNILQGDTCKNDIKKKQQINQEQYRILSSNLRVLGKLAQNLRKNRPNADMFDRGQIVFQLDNNNIPINIGLKKRIQAQKLVQQFMILANSQVAKLLINSFGQHSLIIYHPRPTQCSIQSLNDCHFGIKFKADNLLLLQEQIRKLLSQSASDEMKQFLVMKALRMQQHAIYTRSQNTFKGHYGLNLQHYTHFTSPMRRFADQIVHEQLEMCLNGLTYSTQQITQLQTEIQCMNRARAKSKKLKQIIIECFLNMLLYHKAQCIETKGFILSLGLRSVTVYLPQYNIVKDIPWEHQVRYVGKDAVQVTCTERNRKICARFQKNNYIKVAVESGKHQQVRIRVLVS